MSRTRKPRELSQSEKLRNVFYQLYIKTKSELEFEDFYKEKMDALVKYYHKLLENLK